jgi:hypothetical protein
MSFLAPLFFVALAGLAIPVLLHLTQREKKQVVRFPSLMFVRRIPYQSVRRRKIQNWLLLAVRLTALALVIFAFARPLVTRANTPAAPGTGAREVVILVDTSYSMGYGDRWERARASAHDQISKLQPSDRASIVLFASGAEIALRSTAEQEALSAVVATAKPGAAATRYAPALKVAGSILNESTLPRREVILISDFQRGGWRGEEGARLPRGAILTPLPVQSAADRPNVTVTGVTLARSTFSNQERVAVTAGVINRSERPVNGATIALEVAGLPVASKPLMVDPSGAASVTFDPVTIGGRNMRATVRTSDDALAIDNTFNFMLSPTQPVHVAVVDRGNSSSTLYLSRALAIGDAPRFEAVTREPEALSDEDLKKSAAVLLNDVAVPAPLARRLSRYVEQGGGLFVITGPRASWPQDVDTLPASVGVMVDRTRGDAARIGAIEYGHPVFEPFRAPRSGDFSSARIYAYRNVSASKDAQVLARFDAGAPAVIERRVGAGRVMLWASTVDTTWSDLPIKPVFLPFVHRTVEHIANYHEPRPWLTVGQVLDPDVAASPKGGAVQRIVLTPGGRRVPLEDEGADVMELTEQGFYEIRSSKADSDVGVVAANVDPAESDLTPIDPKEIAAAAVGDPSGAETAKGVPLTPEAQEKNQRLWWYLLCAGIVLLGADTLLSNRLAKA